MLTTSSQLSLTLAWPGYHPLTEYQIQHLSDASHVPVFIFSTAARERGLVCCQNKKSTEFYKSYSIFQPVGLYI